MSKIMFSALRSPETIYDEKRRFTLTEKFFACSCFSKANNKNNKILKSRTYLLEWV